MELTFALIWTLRIAGAPTVAGNDWNELDGMATLLSSCVPPSATIEVLPIILSCIFFKWQSSKEDQTCIPKHANHARGEIGA